MDIERVDEHLKEKLKDPYFKELYELEEQKLGIVKRIIDYRVKNNLTQGQLARKARVTQQHISKIENGDFSSIITRRNPSMPLTAQYSCSKLKCKLFLRKRS
jgi:DNA-binding XRE family transcriptional regulator